MTRQAVAKHLATLADAGLVESERQRPRDAVPADGRGRGMGRSARRASLPPEAPPPMSLYDAVRNLPLHIDGYYLEPLEREVARGFTLRRTVVVLHGNGEEGRGEEVDYDPRAQEAFQADEGKLPFPGEHTLDSFSLLQAGQTEYRRWGFESAALDLALRQAGLSLGEAVGREPQPLRFVVSTRTANVPGWAGALPGPALQARSGPRLDGRGDRDAAQRRDDRLQGDLPRRVRRPARRGAVRARVGGVPRRVDRGPSADAGDDARRSSRTATASPGTRRSTSGATSRHCRSSRSA